jgi:hypothetical protein
MQMLGWRNGWINSLQFLECAEKLSWNPAHCCKIFVNATFRIIVDAVAGILKELDD